MGSSYTDNNKFEKIGTGEQAGTWGTTTNLNFDMIDRAINGVTSIGLTGTSSSITTSDGALTDGLFKVLQFTGSLSAGHTVTIAPNSVKKLYFVKNASGDTVTFIQGTGGTVDNGRAVAIENNKTGIIFCDGTGNDSTAKVQKIETGSDEFTTDVNIKTDDGALLTLQTSDTTITDGDVLGALQFQAPNEGSGTDGAAVAGAIVAEADATFTDEIASTDMVFKVGTAVASDNAAVEKMRLTHEGDIELQNDLTLKSDSSIIKFGADSDINITHVADTGLTTNGDFSVGDDLKLTSDGAVLGFGADNEITVTHVADTGLRFEDSDKLLFGAGADLEISHNATDSIIKNNTNTFRILGNTIAINNSDESNAMALFTSGGAVKLYHNNTERVTTSSSGATINGALTASGDITAFSDERLKSDIETIDDALYKVMNMRGVSYTKQAEKGIGVIAQEVEKVLPEVVTDGEYKSVAYGNIVGVLIEAIKEQQKQIDELKKDK